MISFIFSSKTPWVLGYVTIIDDKFLECCSALALNSSTLMFPFLSVPTTTILRPATAAEAGFVPWADDGIRQIFLCPSPRLSWYLLIASSPAYSPLAPEFGCKETASNWVIVFKNSHNSSINCWYPFLWSSLLNGWISVNSGHVTGIWLIN